MPNSRDLEDLFQRCFRARWRTILVGGGCEPAYLPAAGDDYHQIRYTADYFASALHEVAHWCIAGRERRQLSDYGYWYEPDGRTSEQQRVFERVEAAPQALEWIFSRAAGVRFRLSVDNLSTGEGPSESFKRNVCDAAKRFNQQGLGRRAAEFERALRGFYKPAPASLCAAFDPSALA